MAMNQTENASYPFCVDYLESVRQVVDAKSMVPIELKFVLFFVGIFFRAIAFGPRTPGKPPTNIQLSFAIVGLVLFLCQAFKDVWAVIAVTNAVMTISNQYHLSFGSAVLEWMGAVSWIAGVSSNFSTVLGAWIVYFMDVDTKSFSNEVQQARHATGPADPTQGPSLGEAPLAGSGEQDISCPTIIIMLSGPTYFLAGILGFFSVSFAFTGSMFSLIKVSFATSIVLLPANLCGEYAQMWFPPLMLWIAKHGSMQSVAKSVLSRIKQEDRADDGSQKLLDEDLAQGLHVYIKEERKRCINEKRDGEAKKARESPYGLNEYFKPHKTKPGKKDTVRTEADIEKLRKHDLEANDSLDMKEELEYFEFAHAPATVWRQYFYNVTAGTLGCTVILPFVGRAPACGPMQAATTLLSDQSRQHFYNLQTHRVVALLDFLGNLL